MKVIHRLRRVMQGQVGGCESYPQGGKSYPQVRWRESYPQVMRAQVGGQVGSQVGGRPGAGRWAYYIGGSGLVTLKLFSTPP